MKKVGDVPDRLHETLNELATLRMRLVGAGTTSGKSWEDDIEDVLYGLIEATRVWIQNSGS